MSQEKPKEINMKCRNPKCTSITAVEIPYQQGTRLYRCIKCKHTWPVSVGGKLDLNQI